MDKTIFDKIRDEVVKEVEYLMIAISERNGVIIKYDLTNLKIIDKSEPKAE